MFSLGLIIATTEARLLLCELGGLVGQEISGPLSAVYCFLLSFWVIHFLVLGSFLTHCANQYSAECS